jgi:DNA ligase D-like protein (predicted 3'-phosphoesterase)
MSDEKRKLEKYKEKRDFLKTTEPSDDAVEFDWADQRPIFVIQKHDASTLHYDLRIEAAGVLKSWAVPKGPSTDPSVKRLAIPTEDHPLAYANFEGVIPEGEYGAGTVMIWDRGSYHNLKEDQQGEDARIMAEQIANGHVTLWLAGEKISGGYALIRAGRQDDDDWLLIKMDDEKADARRNPTSTEPTSVKTGRTLARIRKAGKDDG